MNLPKDNNIDNLFKDHFEDMEMPMSGVEDLWSKIENKKKQRFLPFWLSGFSLILIIVSGIIIYQINFDTAPVNNYSSIDNPNETIDQTRINATKNTSLIIENKTSNSIKSNHLARSTKQTFENSKSNNTNVESNRQPLPSEFNVSTKSQFINSVSKPVNQSILQNDLASQQSVNQ